MGRLDQAHEALRRSAEAKRRAGSARIDVMGSELEALRIEVLRGHAREAWPEIAARLDEVRGFWIRRQAGEHVPEAPNDEQLGRTLVGGLDVAQYAQFMLNNWQASLDRAGESAEARSHRLAVLCYRAVTDLDASAAIRNLAIDMLRAATRGERYELPRIADLIAQPAFATLRDFLTERNADLAALQAAIDQLVEQIRQQLPQTDGDG